MSLNGTCACIKSVHLALRILGCGILMASPVVKDPGDMMDLLSSRSFHTAEYKIVILCTVEFFFQHSDLIHDLFFHNKKVTDVVYCTQKVDIEVRFEMRLEEFMTIHGHLIFVGIQNLDLRILIQCFHTLEQGVRCHLIIMICKYDKISGCRFHSRIGILCDLKCLFITDHTDSLIAFFQSGEIIGKRGVCPTSVGKTKLPVSVSLSLNRVHQLLEIFLRSLIKRDHNAELWIPGKFCFSFFRKFSLIRQVLHDPFGIIHRTIFPVHHFSENFSGEGCCPVKFHVAASFPEIYGSFLRKALLWLQMYQTKCPHIAGLKYNIEFLHTVIMEFKEKSALLINFCFLVLVLHVHTFQSGDLAGDLLPAAIFQADGQGAVKSCPSTDTADFFPGFHLNTFDKVLRFSLLFVKLRCRNRKPLDAFSAFYCINNKLLFAFQIRQTDLHLYTLSVYQIQIFKALQGADTLLGTDGCRKFFPVKNGFRLMVFRPGSLKVIQGTVLQVKPVFFYFV